MDYTQNGVWWVPVLNPGSSVRYYYSTTKGKSWSYGMDIPGSVVTHAMFIDKDDYMHVAVSLGGGSWGPRLWYYRGTPNAGRTSYTWDASTPAIAWDGFGNGSLSNSGGHSFHPGLDIVAFRDPTSGWKAFITGTYYNVSTGGYYYNFLSRIDIASGGGVSYDGSWQEGLGGYLNSPYYQSIDFRHTAADDKAVQSALPHIYWAYTLADGSGLLYYEKVTYSAGTWTTGANRFLTAANTVSANMPPSLYYDGTRVVVAYTESTDYALPRIAERDEADTTTTLRNATSLGESVVRNLSIGYDTNSDIWMVANGDTSGILKKSRYNRTAGTWGSWSNVTSVQIDDYYNAVMPRRASPIVAGAILPVVYQKESTNEVYFDVVTTDALNASATTPTIARAKTMTAPTVTASASRTTTALARPGVAGVPTVRGHANRTTVALGRPAVIGSPTVTAVSVQNANITTPSLGRSAVVGSLTVRGSASVPDTMTGVGRWANMGVPTTRGAAAITTPSLGKAKTITQPSITTGLDARPTTPSIARTKTIGTPTVAGKAGVVPAAVVGTGVVPLVDIFISGKVFGSATLAGAGELSAVGVRKTFSTALFGGLGDLTASGEIIGKVAGAAAFGGLGDLTARGTVPTVSTDYRLDVHDLLTDSLVRSDTLGLDYSPDMSFSFALNGPGAISFQLPTRKAEVTQANFAVGQRVLKLYRDNVRVWAGYLMGADGDRDWVTFTGRGWYEGLRRRILDTNMHYYNIEALDIAWQLIAYTQAKSTLGITRDPTEVPSGKTRVRDFCCTDFTLVSEAIEDLAGMNLGFDFWVTPDKVWKTASPRRGTDRTSSVVFDTTKNVTDCRLSLTTEDMATRVFYVGPNPDECRDLDTDAANIATYGLHELGVDMTNMKAETERDEYAAELLRNQAVPLVQATVTAPAELGITFGKFDLGDRVRLIASDGWLTVDRTMRVIDYTVKVGEGCVEEMNVQLDSVYV